MSTAPTIEKQPPQNSQALTTPSPLQMIDRGLAAGISAEAIAALYSVHERWLKEQQRMAFIQAMQTFKANQPEIHKTHEVKFQNKDGTITQYYHAELDKVNKLLAEELRKVGITVSWRPGVAEGRTTMSCVLSHCDGHVEEAGTLSAPADTSGGKNSVQAVGSSVTYLQRYTLLLALGIAAEGKDVDGKSPGSMEENTLQKHLEAIEKASTVDALRDRYNEAKKSASDSKDDEATKQIVRAKDKRLRELKGL